MTFIDKLSHRWKNHHSLLCLGLDPDLSRLALTSVSSSEAIFFFCQQMIDATADLVCAFKPQIAYFSAARAEDALEDICTYIRDKYSDIPIILDAKRGDIGATSTQYAKEAFERYQADAVTVNPYMGFDAVAPYLEWQDRGVFVLCRTSNPSGAEIQHLCVEGEPLYLYIARLVQSTWNRHGQCGLVVAATFPEEIAQVRCCVGDIPLLIPGIGTQGGNIDATIAAGKTPNDTGMILNVSRAILYANPLQEETFFQAARRVAIRLRDEMNCHRSVAS